MKQNEAYHLYNRKNQVLPYSVSGLFLNMAVDIVQKRSIQRILKNIKDFKNKNMRATEKADTMILHIKTLSIFPIEDWK